MRFLGAYGNETFDSGWDLGFNAYMAPGASYFFTRNVAADARVNFFYNGGPAVSSTTGISLDLGLQIFLPRNTAPVKAPDAGS